MARYQYIQTFFLCVLLGLTLSYTTACTSSSDDESTALEAELESMESDGEVDELEELGELADEDLEELDESDELEDVVDEEDDFEIAEDDEEIEEDELENEVADNDDEFDDEDFDDEDFGDEDDEFAEFDEVEKQDQFAQNEKSLAEELNKQQQYPVVQNAQAQFPEEVVGQPGQPGQQVSPLPPGGAMITSETQDINMPDDPIEPQMPQDDLGMADPIIPLDDDEMPNQQTWVPVVKVKSDAFYRTSRLLNAVYIARPGDTLQSISDKIYNDDRSQELLADNKHLAKGIDPGDKIYYNSPNRSDDRSQIKIYYDDIGLPAQYYTTKPNDNMRRLGSKLLGFADGWKEVWAINPSIDSKTILPSGMDIRYWTGNEKNQKLEMAAQEAEQMANPDPISDEEMPAAGSIDDGELPPEPPMPDAQVAMPEPDFGPEPIADIEPFPEEGIEETPVPVATPAVVTAAEQGEGQLLTVGVVALLVIASAALVAIQIKKRKDNTGLSPQSLEYTQV